MDYSSSSSNAKDPGPRWSLRPYGKKDNNRNNKNNLLSPYGLYSDILYSTHVSVPIQRRQPLVLSEIQVTLITLGKH